MSIKDKGQIAPLTGLRAIAAMWVVLVHIELTHPKNAPYWADLLLGSYGTLPVVFFFCLSGFVLTVVYSGRINGSQFCKRGIGDYSFARFARIIPLYVLSIIPALAVLVLRLTSEKISVLKSIPWIPNKLLVMQGSLLDYLLRINIPAWTLIAEVIFYALFPWLLIKVLALPDKKLIKALATTLGIYLVAQIALSAFFYSNETWFGAFAHGVSHFGPPVFVPVFFAGMVLGTIYVRGLVPTWVEKRSGLIYAALGLTILGSAMLRGPVLPVSLISAILAPVFCLAILAATASRGRTNTLLSSRPLQALGVASYAIYITHWPVRDMIQPLLTNSPLGAAPSLVGWVTLLICVGTGFLAHVFVEKPVHRMLTQWKRKRDVAVYIPTTSAPDQVA